MLKSIPSNTFLDTLERKIQVDFTGLPITFVAFPEHIQVEGEKTSACSYKEGKTGPIGDGSNRVVSIGVSRMTATAILRDGESVLDVFLPIDNVSVAQAMIAIHEACHADDCYNQGSIRWGSQDFLDRLARQRAVEFPNSALVFGLMKETVADVGMFFYCRSNFPENIGRDDCLTFVLRRRTKDFRPDHDTSRYLKHLLESPSFKNAEGLSLSISQARRQAIAFLEANVDPLINHLATLTPPPNPASTKSPPAFVKLAATLT